MCLLSGVQTTYWLEGEIPGPSTQVEKVVSASKMKRSTSEHDFFLKVKGRDRAHSMQFNNNPLLRHEKQPFETDSLLMGDGHLTVVSDDPLTRDDPGSDDMPSLVDGLLKTDVPMRNLCGNSRVRADGPYYV